jgi:hypothetical protein
MEHFQRWYLVSHVVQGNVAHVEVFAYLLLSSVTVAEMSDLADMIDV